MKYTSFFVVSACLFLCFNPIRADIEDIVKDRFVSYTFAVDNVLCGNSSTAALDQLMDFFSKDNFVSWTTGPAGTPFDTGVYTLLDLRNKYASLNTPAGGYANFSHHQIFNILATTKFEGLKLVVNTKSYLFEIATTTFLGFTSPTGIIGTYDNDWVLDHDGVFRMRKFHTDTQKLFPWAAGPANGQAFF
jgi:hypothetical protein